MSVRAPEFPTGCVWFNSEPLRLADLRGKIVVLEFWTFCCINCHHNIAQLHELMAHYGDDLVVIAVHSAKFPAEHAAANVRAAVLRDGIRYAVVVDDNFTIWNHYAVRAWPTLVLIDATGRIARTHVGEFQADDLAANIDASISAATERGTLDHRSLAHTPEVDYEPADLLRYPSRLLVAPDNTLYVADTGHHRVIEIRLDAAHDTGEVTRAWGAGDPALRDGAGAHAAFHHPRGLVLHHCTLLVADADNHAVRRIDLDTNEVTTVAGDGTKAHGRIAPAMPASTALRSPWALARTGSGTLVAMTGSHQLWSLDDQTLRLFAGTSHESLEDGALPDAGFSQPSDLALHGDQVYVVDAETSAVRALDIHAGMVTTLVGRGLFTFGDVDGVGDDVRLQHPTGLAYHDGAVYIADTYNNKIKQLDPATRRVHTLIGTGATGHTDGAFAEVTLYEPEGIAAYEQRLYIADTNNHLLRVADLAGATVHTLHITDPNGVLTPQPTGVRLAPIAVETGEITIRLHVALPTGYKPNPDAPLTIQASGDTHSFAPHEQAQIIVAVERSHELTLTLVAYPCAIDNGLCLIHDVRLIVPLVVTKDGPRSVDLYYKVPVSA